jgi:hypothetical protein
VRLGLGKRTSKRTSASAAAQSSASPSLGDGRREAGTRSFPCSEGGGENIDRATVCMGHPLIF